MQEHSSGFVLRRRMRAAVIVGSFHDEVGPLFQELFVGSNDTAHYGLTTDVDRAHRFECGEVSVDAMDNFLGHVLDCNSRLDRLGDFWTLSECAGSSPTELPEWTTATVWIEIRSPSTLLFLRRFDGRIERSSEWTRDLSRAHRFSPSAVLLGSELDAARRHGQFVPVSAARQSPVAQEPSIGGWVNHSLEADAAWAEWRLSQRFGLSDAKARRRALKHAGMTGWHTAGLGWASKRSFAYSEELRRAFDLGRSLFLCSQRQVEKSFGEQQC